MAATDSKIQGFLENNRDFAETWKTPPTMEQIRVFTKQAGGGFIIRSSPNLPSLGEPLDSQYSC